MVTAPPPYSPAGIEPAKVAYSSGWSSVGTARWLRSGSRGSPFGAPTTPGRHRVRAGSPNGDSRHGAPARRTSVSRPEALADLRVRRGSARASHRPDVSPGSRSGPGGSARVRRHPASVVPRRPLPLRATGRLAGAGDATPYSRLSCRPSPTRKLHRRGRRAPSTDLTGCRPTAASRSPPPDICDPDTASSVPSCPDSRRRTPCLRSGGRHPGLPRHGTTRGAAVRNPERRRKRRRRRAHADGVLEAPCRPCGATTGQEAGSAFPAARGGSATGSGS